VLSLHETRRWPKLIKLNIERGQNEPNVFHLKHFKQNILTTLFETFRKSVSRWKVCAIVSGQYVGRSTSQPSSLTLPFN